MCTNQQLLRIYCGDIRSGNPKKQGKSLDFLSEGLEIGERTSKKGLMPSRARPFYLVGNDGFSEAFLRASRARWRVVFAALKDWPESLVISRKERLLR